MAGLLLSSKIAAQLEATLGQNLNKQGWQELKSPHLNILFPAGHEEVAQRVANMVTYQRRQLQESIGEKAITLSMVLQQHTVIPNGFVSLSPFRTEFFSTPPVNMQQLGSMNWMDVLTIHEYRHVQQNSNYLYGATKFLRYLQGENGWAFGKVLSIPNWFAEGDAVWAETKYTKAGRGRTPFFTRKQRAIAEAGKYYDYQTFRNGSLKKMLPDHYTTGYMMVTHLRNQKGVEAWNPIIRDAAAYKHVFYPFSRAMKNRAGYTSSSLLDASWNQMVKRWEDQQDTMRMSEPTDISLPRSTVTEINFPQPSVSGIIMWKSDYKTTDRIVVQGEDGSERVIVAPGFNVDSYFHHDNGKLVWTELSQNPRRNNQSFSDIYLYDEKVGEVRKLTEQANYFSPVFMNSEELLVVHYSPEMEPAIHRFNLKNKAVDEVIALGKRDFIGRLAYDPASGSCIAIIRRDQKLSINKIDLQTGAISPLTTSTHHTIDGIRVYDGHVYYSASFTGIDNIFRTPLDGSMKVEQLTSVVVGAYEPSVSSDGSTLYFTVFDIMGNKVVSQPLQGFRRRLEAIEEPHHLMFQDETPSVFGNENKTIFDQIDSVRYDVTNYSGSPFRGARFHSWLINPSDVKLGVTVFMNNYLNDVSGEFGGGYNLNEDGSFYTAQISYGRFFPVLNIGAERNQRSTAFLTDADTLALMKYHETVLSTSVSVPLKWLKRNFFSSLDLETKYGYHLTQERNLEDVAELSDQNYATIASEVRYAWVRRRALQNIAPRLGAVISGEWVENLSISDNRKYGAQGRVYLPGLWRNHSLQVAAAYQYEPLSNVFQEVDAFRYPRGYNRPLNDEFLRISFDYGFPLLYPDWGFHGITYCKRIRARAFFDYGEGKRFGVARNYHSLGGELIFDNTFFNLSQLISFGFRGSYLLNTDPLEPDATFVPGIFVNTLF
ncbi:MAG: hypothetical protein Tsb0034_00240 [Ekhidna sp.]